MEAQLLCMLSIPPALEEQLIDWLLDRDEPLGFSSAAVHRHASNPSQLTIAEKVRGKQRRLQFQVQMPAGRLDEFIASLHSSFQGGDVHYWVVPLAMAGSLE